MSRRSWVIHFTLLITLSYSPSSSSSLSALTQEEDFQEMVRAAQTMENHYGHLFEKVIVNDDLSAAFGELRLALRKVEMETHWVPISWTHS